MGTWYTSFYRSWHEKFAIWSEDLPSHNKVTKTVYVWFEFLWIRRRYHLSKSVQIMILVIKQLKHVLTDQFWICCKFSTYLNFKNSLALQKTYQLNHFCQSKSIQIMIMIVIKQSERFLKWSILLLLQILIILQFKI